MANLSPRSFASESEEEKALGMSLVWWPKPAQQNHLSNIFDKAKFWKNEDKNFNLFTARLHDGVAIRQF